MTNWLAVVIVGLFLLLWGIGQIDFAAVVGGFVPGRVLQPDLFGDIGGPVGFLPVWITPLTATLIHANFLHIGFNLLMLVFCGRYVEHVLGPWLMLGLYVAGAYAAAALEWLIHPAALQPMVGASGAISALLGTYALLYSQQKVKRLGPLSPSVVRMLWLAAGWTVIQIMVGLATADGLSGLGQIAIGAHIGGFIAGLVLTRPLLHLRFRQRPVGVR